MKWAFWTRFSKQNRPMKPGPELTAQTQPAFGPNRNRQAVEAKTETGQYSKRNLAEREREIPSDTEGESERRRRRRRR